MRDEFNLNRAEFAAHHCDERGVLGCIRDVIDSNRRHAAIIAAAQLQVESAEKSACTNVFQRNVSAQFDSLR